MENAILDVIKTNLTRAAVRLNTLNEAGIMVEIGMRENVPTIFITDKAFNSLYGDNFKWLKDFSDYYHKAVLVENIYIATKSSRKKPELEVEDEIAE